jgi:hypothetical protein
METVEDEYTTLYAGLHGATSDRCIGLYRIVFHRRITIDEARGIVQILIDGILKPLQAGPENFLVYHIQEELEWNFNEAIEVVFHADIEDRLVETLAFVERESLELAFSAWIPEEHRQELVVMSQPNATYLLEQLFEEARIV